MPAMTFTARLGRKVVGTFDDLAPAVAALVAARGPGSHEGHVVCARKAGAK